MTEPIGYQEARRRAARIAELLRTAADLVDAAPDAGPVELPGGQLVSPGLGLDREAAALRRRAAELDAGIFTLVVLGDFNNGKSTLLNALLGGSPLPTGATPTTGVISVIGQASDRWVRVYEQGRSEPLLLTPEAFERDYRLRTQDAASELLEYRLSRIEYAWIPYQHRLCANGVRLVDTPGLGEHISRSQIALQYLRQAQAVIFVLNATRVLTLEERRFIRDELGHSRSDQVFFVVNRINQIPSQERHLVEARVLNKLQQHFLDSQGQFDASRFAQRVFFVDAQGAYEARLRDEGHPEQLSRSGLLGFEQQLEAFLTSAPMFRASVASSLQALAHLGRMVEQEASLRSRGLDQPLGDLRARQIRLNDQLVSLQLTCREIERTILLVGERVQRQLETDLAEDVERLRLSWPALVETLIPQLNSITTGDLLKAAAQQSTREDIARQVRWAIEKTLRQHFQDWSKRAGAIVQTELDLLQQRLRRQLADFSEELNRIRNEFIGGDQQDSFQAEQTVLVDISRIILVGGRGGWGVIYGMLSRLCVLIAFVSITTAPLFALALLVAVALAELKVLSDREESFKRRMLLRAGRVIIDNMALDLRSDGLTPASIRDPAGLARLIAGGATPLAAWIAGQLAPDVLRRLGNVDPHTADGEGLRSLLAQQLNLLVDGPPLSEAMAFAEVRLTDQTRRLLSELPPDDDGRRRRNRMLVVEALGEYVSPKLRDLIYDSVRWRFIEDAHATTDDLRGQIDRVGGLMDTVIREADTKQQNISREQARLAALCEGVRAIVAAVGGQAFDQRSPPGAAAQHATPDTSAVRP